jgi:HD-like signal output (HDOD) protein
MPWNPFKKQAKPEPAAEAPRIPEVRRFSPEHGPARKRLYVWAESPEQRQRIESSLSQDQWLTLPTSQTGDDLVNLVRNGRLVGIIFQYQPGMQTVLDCLRLLETECPECPRFVLCSDEGREEFRSWQGVPPAMLKEGVPPAQNEERVARAVTLNQWLTQPAIRAVLPRLRSIPTLPASHQRVVEALQNPNFSVDEVVRLLSHDLALTANLFKTVNSTAFGLRESIFTIRDAVTMLGVERLQALVMSAWAFHFINNQTCPGFEPEAEWSHAVEVARVAGQLGAGLGDKAKLSEAAFTAGLLHDVGKLLLAANDSAAYSGILARANEGKLELWQVEKESLGFSHAEIGACLLGVWGNALPIVEAAAWHHEPARAVNQRLSPLTLVHLANCQVRGLPPDPAQARLAGMT